MTLSGIEEIPLLNHVRHIVYGGINIISSVQEVSLTNYQKEKKKQPWQYNHYIWCLQNGRGKAKVNQSLHRPRGFQQVEATRFQDS
jgi:hypothetical protein